MCSNNIKKEVQFHHLLAHTRRNQINPANIAHIDLQKVQLQVQADHQAIHR